MNIHNRINIIIIIQIKNYYLVISVQYERKIIRNQNKNFHVRIFITYGILILTSSVSRKILI